MTRVHRKSVERVCVVICVEESVTGEQYRRADEWTLHVIDCTSSRLLPFGRKLRVADEYVRINEAYVLEGNAGRVRKWYLREESIEHKLRLSIKRCALKANVANVTLFDGYHRIVDL